MMEYTLLIRLAGIPGLGSGVIHHNAPSQYAEAGDPHVGNAFLQQYVVVADITTSFTVLVGIYFPSVTGIMAGCSNSGRLKDPSTSIPLVLRQTTQTPLSPHH